VRRRREKNIGTSKLRNLHTYKPIGGTSIFFFLKGVVLGLQSRSIVFAPFESQNLSLGAAPKL
jgi:hypothetical protein